jgi:2-iminobutanoate/2-iminopropanoate deaminase
LCSPPSRLDRDCEVRDFPLFGGSKHRRTRIADTRTLFCAGQTSVDQTGRPVHAGDMRAQITQAFDNLEAVLHTAGFGLGDVVRLNYYTTDVDRLLEAYETLTNRLASAKCQPSSTLLGVDRLAFAELLIEIEATAAK